MARRVSIGKNTNSSPFTVAAEGVDASAATVFTQILFDANQQPLRLLGTGYIGWINSPPVLGGFSEMRSSVQYSFPSGAFPVALAAGKQQAGEGINSNVRVAICAISNPVKTPINFRQQGFGLMINTDGWLWGVNFYESYQIGTPEGPVTYTPPPVMIYYALMRNMG